MITSRACYRTLLVSQRPNTLLALLAFLCCIVGLAAPIRSSIDRRSHKDTPGQVKISLAVIPEEFTKGSLENLLGFASLGKTIDIDNSFWESQWHEVDKWWINQLTISPLRVSDDDQADIIFVPATLRSKLRSCCDSSWTFEWQSQLVYWCMTPFTG